MTIDYTKSPDEILVQLINDENSRTFTTADLDLTNVAIAPDPISGRETFNNTRTSIGVAAADNSGYIGGVTVTYNRVPVRDVFKSTDPLSTRYPTSNDSYTLGDRTQLVDILPDINAKHSINITPSDVFDVPLPVFTGPPPYDPAYVRLEIAGIHKVFFGGINLRILPNDWALSNLQYVELGGLFYPTTTDPSPVPQTWTDIDNQIIKIAAEGYFQYVTEDPGDGTTPPSASALASFAAIDTQFTSLGSSGAWNYQPH